VNILVTGVSGFAGSILANRLSGAGHAVTGLHRRSSRFLESLESVRGVFLHAGDLRSLELAGPFDIVVHAAATSPQPGVDILGMVEDNVVATKTLIGLAEHWRSRCFIFCSSLSLYGTIEAAVVDESTPIISPDAYGATKHICELMLQDCSTWLPSLSLRLPGVLGPGAHRNWMSGVAERLLRGDVIRAFNLDQPFNNAVHVDDIANFAAHVIAKPFTGAHSVVLGASGMVTIGEAIEALAQSLGVRAHIEVVSAKKHSFCLSSERAIKEWGYAPLEIQDLLRRYAQDVLFWNALNGSD
jgi:nucleoside-diphosphate-sugar epimerase